MLRKNLIIVTNERAYGPVINYGDRAREGGGYKMGRMGKFYPNKMGGGKGLSHSNGGGGGGGHNKF